MQTHQINASSRGLVKFIILIIIALIILGYFGYNLRSIIDSPTVHDNLAYVWDLTVRFWNYCLKAPLEYIFGLILKALGSKS
ncbi:MAG: hypothetical protein NTZ38_02940 [Candidatus Taylorbacteria bacterium]|nr:hypothetical protein [Candidatus Taylorbacteria bacterium]